MSNLNELNLVLKAVAANNEIIVDETGGASVMVRIPAFKISDVVEGGADELHPAFIVNGVEVPEVWISKFQNVVVDGIPQSHPAVEPTGEHTFDEAVAACRSKGKGWHMMTNAEWAAIGLWCRKNGFFPDGNNHLGKGIDEPVFTAIPASYDQNGARARVLNGTGPVSWSHNNEISGIYDLNGNVVEHAAGARTVYGELHIVPDNDAATLDDLTVDSPAWRAVLPDGSYVDPGTPGTLKYDYISKVDERSGTTAARGKDDGMEGDGRFVIRTELQNQAEYCRFGDFVDMVADDGLDIPEALKALALFPYEGGNFNGGLVFVNNGVDERVFNRGGAQHSKAGGGPFFYSGNGHRDRRSPAVGFRASYIPGIE